MTPHLSEAQPASFRDPEGHVVFEPNRVRRILNTTDAQKRMKRLLSQDFFQNLLGDTIVSTQLLGNQLVHARIPTLTYPYEWSFEMLKDAALSQLNLLLVCLDRGFILKDGSGFNTLYDKGKMVFVDLLSIDDYREGQIWEGYAQFCRHFLYPLMLQSACGLLFQDGWRGRLNGFSVDDTYAVLGWRRCLMVPGGFKHVMLQKMLSGVQTFRAQPPGEQSCTAQTKTKLTMPKAALFSFLKSLSRTVRRLNVKSKTSVWSGYAVNNTYAQRDQKMKESFITDFLKAEKVNKLVDLGCNTGHYAFLAAPMVKNVIAVDYDAHCIDKLYLSLKKDQTLKAKIIPMVGNLMNPSPDLGWGLEERDSQLVRLASDGFLALALVHHVCIAENVPLPMFAAFLRKMGACGVVEWVGKDDLMVQTLLRNRQDIFPNYTWAHFEACLTKHFHITKTQDVNQGTRKLVWVSHV